MMREYQLYGLITKLLTKGEIDWENDGDFNETERSVIRQSLREADFYKPQLGTGSKQERKEARK